MACVTFVTTCSSGWPGETRPWQGGGRRRLPVTGTRGETEPQPWGWQHCHQGQPEEGGWRDRLAVWRETPQYHVVPGWGGYGGEAQWDGPGLSLCYILWSLQFKTALFNNSLRFKTRLLWHPSYTFNINTSQDEDQLQHKTIFCWQCMVLHCRDHCTWYREGQGGGGGQGDTAKHNIMPSPS